MWFRQMAQLSTTMSQAQRATAFHLIKSAPSSCTPFWGRVPFSPRTSFCHQRRHLLLTRTCWPLLLLGLWLVRHPEGWNLSFQRRPCFGDGGLRARIVENLFVGCFIQGILQGWECVVEVLKNPGGAKLVALYVRIT